MSYENLIDHEDYEILNVFPYSIRKKSNGKIISESDSGNGYVQVYLNCKPFYKHRLVALQFIPNPDPVNLTDVDHINRDRSDYRIENLRWVTKSSNSKNKSSSYNVDYIYIDYEDEPEDLIVVDSYGNHDFENYYYSPENNKFYFDNGIALRELHINIQKKSELAFVYAKDIDDKRVLIYYTKFKRVYGLD